MPQTTIELIVLLNVALCATIIAFLFMRSKVNQVYQLCLNLSSQIIQVRTLAKKLEAISCWFLDRKNMTVDCTGTWPTPYLVVAKKDANEKELSEAWAAIYLQREELAQALYEASLKAMRAFHAEEQNSEQTRREIYTAKKALRRAKK